MITNETIGSGKTCLEDIRDSSSVFKHSVMIKIGILKCGIRWFSAGERCKMTFEGNSHKIVGTDEERMIKVFGGRLKGDALKSTSRMIRGGEMMIAGVKVPAKPIAPDNCCMSGCVNCVWERYNEDVREWREKRADAIQNIKHTTDVWPANWDPPLVKLDSKNVPATLKNKKIDLEVHMSKSKSDILHLFPSRNSPLLASVLEAKRRNIMKKAREAKKLIEESDNDGWNGISVYIKAFAEFERKKILLKEQHKQNPI